MTETRKTLAWIGVAILLVLGAWVTRPRTAGDSAFPDRGQPFFPDFTDPNTATSLEVVEFDEQTSIARPFKVLNRDGRWTIPSRDNYPADGAHRLPSIAAAVIALKKNDLVSESVGDQERCGVLDPLDETLPTPKGRGTRITVKGRNDRILADIIAGKQVEGRPSLRYVRLPGQKRTYVADVGELAVSTAFEDWIERNLLQVDREEIDQVAVRNYSVEPKNGNVTNREVLLLRKKDKDRWTAEPAAPGESIDTFKMNLLITKLVDLAIIDVRAKPPGVTASLSQAAGTTLPRADVNDLANKGFYFTREGQLLSNQGEVLVHTTAGIFYILRFGEVVHAAAPTAAATPSRYLFITVGFDANAGQGSRGSQRLDLLRARFAPWYYVISDDHFKKIRLTRSEIMTSRGR